MHGDSYRSRRVFLPAVLIPGLACLVLRHILHSQGPSFMSHAAQHSEWNCFGKWLCIIVSTVLVYMQ